MDPVDAPCIYFWNTKLSPVALFQPECWFGNPRNYVFSLSKKIYIFCIKVSKKMFDLILKAEALLTTCINSWQFKNAGKYYSRYGDRWDRAILGQMKTSCHEIFSERTYATSFAGYLAICNPQQWSFVLFSRCLYMCASGFARCAAPALSPQNDSDADFIDYQNSMRLPVFGNES